MLRRAARAACATLAVAAWAGGVLASEGPLSIKQIDYHGWSNSYRLDNGLVELVATADIGPRIVDFRAKNGDNVFYLRPAELGGSGESDWTFRGGWRLWIAPETKATTYDLDNESCAVEIDGSTLRLTGRAQPRAGIAKTLEISLPPGEPGARVVSHIRNVGTEPVTYAAWTLSVMRPGGRAFVPMDVGNPTAFSDFRRLLLWSYTEVRDPRYTFGDSFVQIDHRRVPPGPPVPPGGRRDDESKIGVDSAQGWAAYVNDGVLYLKRFPHETGAVYPDGGSTIEVYSSAEFLEVENLSPLVTLKPGEEIVYPETWWIRSGVELPADAAEAAREVSGVASRIPAP